jgi:hypothetical protein
MQTPLFGDKELGFVPFVKVAFATNAQNINGNIY